ncbi:hypothetical protein AC788_19610 [Pseudomonas sp. RIT-PI-a]|nr:hypothetical protein AC788_19610 [Pseudomonas sp. RIT-PI-a]
MVFYPVSDADDSFRRLQTKLSDELVAEAEDDVKEQLLLRGCKFVPVLISESLGYGDSYRTELAYR